MSFRWFLRVVALVLVALTLVGIATLLATTRYLDAMGRHVGEVAETVRAGVEIEVNLLRHDRAGTSSARARAAAESRLVEWIAVARRNADSPAEAALVADVDDAVEEYLSAAARVGVGGRPEAERAPVGDESLATAVRAAERLVHFNRAEAEAMHLQARGWRRSATAAGIAAGILLVLMEVAVLGAIRFGVAAPLETLRGAIGRYAERPGFLHVPERGTTELREVTRTFNEMAAALEERRERQLGFIAGVVHDLRNPLTALKMTIARLGADRGQPPEERLRPMLTMIARQVERLERMLGDLLDTARISAGRLELHRELRDLRDTAQEAVSLYESMSEMHRLHLSVPEEPIRVHHDPVRLGQVLNNLMSNAIKYSPGGGGVEVRVGREGREALLSVSDEGLGIPPEEQERIFEPFRRSARRGVEEIPGAGLGLSVSRRIVEAHGGRISVQSTPGVGSTFSVRLPLISP